MGASIGKKAKFHNALIKRPTVLPVPKCKNHSICWHRSGKSGISPPQKFAKSLSAVIDN